MTLWAYFAESFSLHYITAAVVCGLLIGFSAYPVVLEHWMRRHLQPETADLLLRTIPYMTLLTGLPVMAALFAAFTLADYLIGEPNWPFVFGRGLTVLVFVVSLSAGMWLRVGFRPK